VNPEPNALVDTISFLTRPDWPTGVYWLALVIGLYGMIRAWRGDPSQRTGHALGVWMLRVAMGTMWWQQSLWKIPPNYDGLKYWMQQMVEHAAIPLQVALVRDVLLPWISLSGPAVYTAEALIGVCLITGCLTRWAGLLGLGMAVNLWLGLYSAPGEWPWTYGYLVILQTWFVIDPPGRYLGFERRR
jgi:uncharacterized membrane protein YphA (DoxX/SURF4 family)